jgi:cysteine desulfuration protein SufE
MLSLQNKKEALLAELSAIRDPQHRFAHVIAKGGSYPPIGNDYRTDEFRIEGCLASLWMVPEQRDGRCFFRSDSDSAIVRGIAGVVCEFYSGGTPEEILNTDTSFLEDVGINQHLTANRRNGLGRLETSIREFAQAHVAA